MSELQPWLDRVVKAQSNDEMFGILDEFRPMLWSDEERASMAKIYNAKFYQIRTNQGAANEKRTEKTDKNKSSSNISKQDAGNQRGESISSYQDLDEDIE